MGLAPRTPDGALVAIVVAAALVWQGRSVLLMADIYVSMMLWVWIMMMFLGMFSLLLTVAPPITEKPDGRAATSE